MSRIYTRTITTQSERHGLYEATADAVASIAAAYSPEDRTALMAAIQEVTGFGDDKYWSDLNWVEAVIVLASFLESTP